VVVLGCSVAVAIIGLAAAAAVRSQRVSALAVSDAAQATLCAESGVELAAQAVAADPRWRSGRAAGAATAAYRLPLGEAAVTFTDRVDGLLDGNPYDPIVVSSEGVYGRARRVVEATLVARGTAFAALSSAVHATGDLTLASGGSLTVTGAPATTWGVLTTGGPLSGDAHCAAAAKPVNVTGVLTEGAGMSDAPATDAIGIYRALAKPIRPSGNTIERAVLSAASNPWGDPSPSGVYIWESSGNVRVRNMRIEGTLIIVARGRKVDLEDQILMGPGNPAYATLIVDGGLRIAINSAATLSESALGTNFNPAGTPFKSSTDSDTADEYPCEVRGLVHALEGIAIENAPVVRGVVLAGLEAKPAAITVQSGSATVVHDPALVASPPLGYARSVVMTPRAGSWVQVVSP
jgi:hypothetical protein